MRNLVTCDVLRREDVRAPRFLEWLVVSTSNDFLGIGRLDAGILVPRGTDQGAFDAKQNGYLMLTRPQVNI